MSIRYYNKLRQIAARALGIDPDRIDITEGPKEFHYVATVQGAISGDAAYELRKVLVEKTALHITWTVKATIA